MEFLIWTPQLLGRDELRFYERPKLLHLRRYPSRSHACFWLSNDIADLNRCHETSWVFPKFRNFSGSVQIWLRNWKGRGPKPGTFAVRKRRGYFQSLATFDALLPESAVDLDLAMNLEPAWSFATETIENATENGTENATEKMRRNLQKQLLISQVVNLLLKLTQVDHCSKVELS